jgi:hypothetical protein
MLDMLLNLITIIKIDAPPNSLKDPNVGFEMKQWKKKGVGACSLAYSTCGVKKYVRASRWD